jgi:hypothetical protein
MGMTLNDLLSTSGISELKAGSPSIKTAAAGGKADFRKLAERCRRAASPATALVDRPQDRELQEKTASEAVIQHTMSEIRAIVGEDTHSDTEKIASDGVGTAEFIKEALRQGHKPDAIASFLKQAGIGGEIENMVNRVRGSRAITKGTARAAEGAAQVENGERHWSGVLRDVARNGNRAKQESIISKLRQAHGDEKAAEILSSSGAQLHHTEEARALRPFITKKTEKPVLSANIGGKDVGMTAQQLKGAAKPAALGTAGIYLGSKLHGGSDDKKKKGVVVVNS